jgi:hypothetical protein
VANRFDVGVVDTPSLDDALARTWLREAAAALMVLQVDPLTVKTLPGALNTLELVRAFKPSIQILGLLPTMFDEREEAHGRLLAELLSRRPEAVFTPVVPADPGLMHRANVEDCPPIGEAARQAYQCAVDRILRALASAAPSVSMPRAAPAAQRFAQEAPPAPAAPARAPAGASARPEPRRWEAPEEPIAVSREVRAPGYDQPVPAVSQSPFAGRDRQPTPDPPASRVPGHPTPNTRDPAPDAADPALEALTFQRVEEPRRKRPAENATPDWWPRQEVRVDKTGVVRRRESWLARSRFAIACTVACLALIAAVVLGTVRRVPAGNGGSNWVRHVPAAVAATREARPTTHRTGDPPASTHSGDTRTHQKPSARKHAHHSSQVSGSGDQTGK